MIGLFQERVERETSRSMFRHAIFKLHGHNNNTMKTRITSFLLFTAFLPVFTNVTAADGGRSGSNNRMNVERFTESRAALDRAVEERGLMVNIEPAMHGSFDVTVKSNIGITLLKGQYLNRDLTMPHGEFTYYHPNGRIESKGHFDHGVKTGSWVRYSLSGKELARREYTGLNAEELLEDAGIFSVARTRVDRTK